MEIELQQSYRAAVCWQSVSQEAAEMSTRKNQDDIFAVTKTAGNEVDHTAASAAKTFTTTTEHKVDTMGQKMTFCPIDAEKTGILGPVCPNRSKTIT